MLKWIQALTTHTYTKVVLNASIVWHVRYCRYDEVQIFTLNGSAVQTNNFAESVFGSLLSKTMHYTNIDF